VGREILTLGEGFNTQGNYPMVFLHSGARDFDLGGGFQHSGNYPMVFLHSGARGVSLGSRIHIHIHIHRLGSSMGTGTWLAISRYLTQKGHRAKQVVDFGLVASRRRKRYRPLAAHNLL
jgi:hypothetical protein